ncbi:MAG: hypothetical protein ACREEM_24335 [Blastocatellia bacterium]
MWNKNEAEEIKGSIKDKAGELIGNPELELASQTGQAHLLCPHPGRRK